SELRKDDAALAQLRDEAAALKVELQAAAAKASRAGAIAAPTSPARVALSGAVFEMNKVDQTPKPVFQARPAYPFEMRRAGTQGEVVVDFVVDAKGEVQNAFALRSSQREFEASAVQAVSKWKFQPGLKGGAAVNTHLQIPIVFTVSKESG